MVGRKSTTGPARNPARMYPSTEGRWIFLHSRVVPAAITRMMVRSMIRAGISCNGTASFNPVWGQGSPFSLWLLYGLWAPIAILPGEIFPPLPSSDPIPPLPEIAKRPEICYNKERMNQKQLHMQPVSSRYLEQYNALLRYVFQVTDQELSSVGWQEKEFIRAKFPTMEKADVIGWFDRDTLVSQVAVYPMQARIFGRTYAMGGLTGVGTYPEYSNLGLMHKLLEQALTNMRARGQYLSYLYPYSIPYYRRKGWEVVSDKISYVIQDFQLPKARQVPGYVRRVKTDSEALNQTYARFAQHTHGAVLRDELAWNEYWLWDPDDIMAAIVKGVDVWGVHLLPCDMRMLKANRTILMDNGPRQFHLRDALKCVAGDYDYCIMDCPPDLDMGSINALCAADWVIIPVDCDKWACDGMQEIVEQIEQVQAYYNPRLKIMGALMTKYRRTRYAEDIIVQLCASGISVLETVIRYTVKVSEAAHAGMPLLEYCPDCTAAVDYRELTEEVERIVSNVDTKEG